MEQTLLEQIMGLKDGTLDELRAKYAEIFPKEAPSSNNKVFLWRKIAYRLQEIEYGGLSAEINGRITELVNKYDPVNNKSLRPKPSGADKKNSPGRDMRLPIPGAVIRKEYKGKLIEVKVLEKSFEYEGKIYRTLSSVAKAVTGAHWNGYLFFKP